MRCEGQGTETGCKLAEPRSAPTGTTNEQSMAGPSIQVIVDSKKSANGLGMVLETKGNRIQVDAIIAGSPAASCGKIEVGDVLLELNGLQVDQMTSKAKSVEFQKDCIQLKFDRELVDPTNMSEIQQKQFAEMKTQRTLEREAAELREEQAKYWYFRQYGNNYFRKGYCTKHEYDENKDKYPGCLYDTSIGEGHYELTTGGGEAWVVDSEQRFPQTTYCVDTYSYMI